MGTKIDKIITDYLKFITPGLKDSTELGKKINRAKKTYTIQLKNDFNNRKRKMKRVYNKLSPDKKAKMEYELQQAVINKATEIAKKILEATDGKPNNVNPDSKTS